MSTTTLKKITTRAKQIRKKQPGISWRSAVKKAGAEYRGGKIRKTRKARKTRPARKKKAVPRKRVKATKKAPRSRVKIRVSSGTVSGHMGAAKKMLLDDIGRKDAQIFAATKKIVKRKLQKQLNKMKQQYRKLVC